MSVKRRDRAGSAMGEAENPYGVLDAIDDRKQLGANGIACGASWTIG